MGQHQDRNQQNQANPGSGSNQPADRSSQQERDRGQASQGQQDQGGMKQGQRGQDSASDESLSDEDEQAPGSRRGSSQSPKR